MKALALTYLGVCAAACAWYVARYVVVSRRMARADALLRSRILAEWRKNQRFLDELYATPTKPRVETGECGVFVWASCEAEAAEIIAISPIFINHEVA